MCLLSIVCPSIEVSHQHSQVLSKQPLVFFTGFGNSALEFDLLGWIATPSKQLIIKNDLYFSIEVALRKHDIEIPFPQQDLHIRSGQLPLELSNETLNWIKLQQEGSDHFPSPN